MTKFIYSKPSHRIEINDRIINRSKKLLLETFKTDPITRLFFPDDEEFSLNMPNIIDNTIALSLLEGQFWCDSNVSSVACFTKFHFEDKVLDVAAKPYQSNEWIEALVQWRKKIALEERPELYFEYMAVKKELRNSGIGFRLLRAIRSKPINSPKKVYLEASSSGSKRFLAKYGFREIDKIELARGIYNTAMIGFID